MSGNKRAGYWGTGRVITTYCNLEWFFLN
jgi:hypothetical protein